MALTLAPASNTGSYTWTASENGVFYLICTVGSHCTGGNMKQRITVSGCPV